MDASLIIARTALLAIALYVAHQIADHWVQTERQATQKSMPGWAGRWACTKHVATLTFTLGLTVTSLAALLPLAIPWPKILAGLAINAVSHYIADRRTPLRWMAKALAGKRQFVNLGLPREGRDDNPSLGTGLYALDQSWHLGWLLVVAVGMGC